MLSTVHTLISLPFGVYLQNPVLIFLAAFVFHFFADSLLHWNIFPDKFKKYPYALVSLDILIGLLLAWFVLGDQFFTPTIWIAIAGGNMPDILHELWNMLGVHRQDHSFFWAKPYFRFHKNLQLETYSFKRGIVWQIVLVAIALTAIIL